MAQSRNNPLRFEYVVYPLWRRRLPAPLRLLAAPFFRAMYPVAADQHPPDTPQAMARYLARWHILAGSQHELERALSASTARVEVANLAQHPQRYTGPAVRIPAQWEPTERILLSWGILYPPLWPMHARMTESISAAADVEILVPTMMWAHAVWLYLHRHGAADMARVRFLVLPTNDIWIRDYGPLVGVAPDGQKVAVNPIYDVLPAYPQQDDNAMVERWAAHHGLPTWDIDLHTEGGNLWSDGQGTLMMSEQVFYSNRYYERDTLEGHLRQYFDFEKLIISPRLTLEETGHIDLLVKLASADTVLVSAATSMTTATALRKNQRLFLRERNAAGSQYKVLELPTPPLYLNWFAYTIRRSYTNALTVNGRVLVPVFGVPEDEQALRIYEQAMPGYTIVPIDSRVGINGGGAVHCMTKEVPG